MSGAALLPISLDTFLEWERGQDGRHEFDGLTPVAMTGGTIRHRLIADALARLLNDRLAASGCLALAGDVKIVVAGRVRYPDVVVTCGRPDLAGDVVPDPVVVAEVLSAGTARTDRILKLEEYRLTPSIQHYVLLEQETAEGVLFTREGERWIAEVVSRPGEIPLAALGIALPMTEIYRGVVA